MTEDEFATLLTGALERHRGGRVREAIADYRRALDVHPDHPDVLNLLASALRSQGETDLALPLARRAAAAAPDRADIAYNLGNALSAARLDTEAAAAFRASLELNGNQPDAAANLGIALGRLGDGRAAEAAYGRALELDPSHRIAGLNLGNLISDGGRGDEGLALLRRVTLRHPDLAEAHYNLGLALLRAGDWTTGFAEYEWRWKTADFASPVRHADIADWDGRSFAGKRLLVHAEQGLGDTIQFVRLLSLAASLGGEIVLEVPTVLVALLRGVAGAAEVTDRPDLAACDLQTPLLGLPHRLGLTLGAIPATTRGIAADPERVARWRERLGDDGRPIVGVSWRGNPSSPADRGRSLDDVGRLAPLAATGVRLVALHKMTESELEAAPVPSGRRVGAAAGFVIEHPGADFDAGRDAFLDTAAVMALSAAIVTTDTSLAHLAGVLRRPTAVLLKRVADWRWLEGRADTPWYPGMRLLRQTIPGDFGGPIAEAAAFVAEVCGPLPVAPVAAPSKTAAKKTTKAPAKPKAAAPKESPEEPTAAPVKPAGKARSSSSPKRSRPT